MPVLCHNVSNPFFTTIQVMRATVGVRMEAAVGCSKDSVTVLLLTPVRFVKVRHQCSLHFTINVS